MSEKICPLRDGKCLSKCAMWIPKIKNCAFVEIAMELYTISYWLEEIKEMRK